MEKGQKYEYTPTPPKYLEHLRKKYQIPEHKWWEILDYLGSTDDILRAIGYILIDALGVLYDIRERIRPSPRPVVTPPAMPPPVTAPTVELPEVMRTYSLPPNRCKKVTIDTSKTEEIYLTKKGYLQTREYTGIYIESVGGGFSFSFVYRDKGGDEFITAKEGMSISFRFTDLVVKGSGTAGTGVIWVFWLE